MQFDLQKFATVPASSVYDLEYGLYDSISEGDTVQLTTNINVPAPDDMGMSSGEIGSCFLYKNNVTLDLNGYTITGNNSADYSSGVLNLYNTSLTIIDSSANKTGTISNNGTKPAVCYIDG